MKNRQYEEMLAAAKKKLEGRDPRDIAEKGGLSYNEDKQEFCFSTFGTEVAVSYPDYRITLEREMWLALSVLQYMDEADGTPLTGKLMALHEFKEGGLVRGASFDKEIDAIIQPGIGNAVPADIIRAITALGGEILPGKADISAKISFMPRYPLYINLWLADDEFPASCKILFDNSAEHYLRVEAAGTIAGTMLKMITELISTK